MIAPAVSPLHFEILSHPRSVTLPSGHHLLLLDMPDTPLVQIDCMIPCGARAQDIPLQAKFATRLLRKGTLSYPSDQIGEAIDFLGAKVRTTCNAIYTHASICGLHRNFPELLRLLHSMLTEPLYDRAPFDIAVAQELSAWEIEQQKVETVARNQFYHRLLAYSPQLSHLTERDDFQRITPQHLRDFHHRHLSLSKATIMLTGCFADEDIALLGETFGMHPAAEDASALSAVAEGQNAVDAWPATPLRFKMERHTLQSSVRVGRLLPPTRHPDFPLLRLAHTILGGYFGSRLESNIRETRGLTYDIHSSLYDVGDHAVFCVSTETPNAKVAEVLEQIDLEMKRMATEPVPEEELNNVKQYLIGNDTRDFEPSFRLPRTVLDLLACGRTLEDYEQSNRLIEQASPDDVRHIAAQYYRPEEFLRCVAGS